MLSLCSWQWVSGCTGKVLCGRYPVDPSLLLPRGSILELVSTSLYVPISLLLSSYSSNLELSDHGWSLSLARSCLFMGKWSIPRQREIKTMHFSIVFLHLLSAHFSVLKFLLNSWLSLQVLPLPLCSLPVWHQERIRIETLVWPWKTLHAIPATVGGPASCQQGAAA